MQDQHITDTLHPVIQAAHLLQARKTPEDVTSICEMCKSLTAEQICRILQMYTPHDDFEERPSPSFIKLVQEKLRERITENKETEVCILIKPIPKFLELSLPLLFYFFAEQTVIGPQTTLFTSVSI